MNRGEFVGLDNAVWGMVWCRFTRHINSSQFYSCPLKAQLLSVQQRDGQTYGLAASLILS